MLDSCNLLTLSMMDCDSCNLLTLSMMDCVYERILTWKLRQLVDASVLLLFHQLLLLLLLLLRLELLRGCGVVEDGRDAAKFLQKHQGRRHLWKEGIDRP